jgi:hypothetical protein
VFYLLLYSGHVYVLYSGHVYVFCLLHPRNSKQGKFEANLISVSYYLQEMSHSSLIPIQSRIDCTSSWLLWQRIYLRGSFFVRRCCVSTNCDHHQSSSHKVLSELVPLGYSVEMNCLLHEAEVILKKLSVFQLANKLPFFYGTQRFITMFKITC